MIKLRLRFAGRVVVCASTISFAELNEHGVMSILNL
jgi:hypothetical protein